MHRSFAKLVDIPGDWPGTITQDPRGRLRIYLGKQHPAANSGGWTWLPRFIVWRAERLLDITEDSAKAEGLGEMHLAEFDSLRSAYLDLWTSINPKAPAAGNPWVWVLKWKPEGIEVRR